MIRVVLAEDSPTTREYLLWLLGAHPGLAVVAVAGDGDEAVEQVADARPDVVLMDVYMPRQNGYAATRAMMERTPTPIVLMSASFEPNEVDMTFEALQAGALAVVQKPAGPAQTDDACARRLIDTVRLMSEVRVVHRWSARGQGIRDGGMELEAPGTWNLSPQTSSATSNLRVIAMGASTGGPGALMQVLGSLPPTLRAAVLIAQHITPGFASGFADWLGRTSGRPVKLAAHEDQIAPGVVYVAPDGAHLGLHASGRIQLSQAEVEGGSCPSATHLFRSVAHAYGRSAAGVLLTGMGRDGAAGLLELRRAGGTTIAQDDQSSIVYGMPGEAVRLGAAMHVLPPDQIGRLLGALDARRTEQAAKTGGRNGSRGE